MIDFEKAVMNAIQNSLPGWEISNCYFHLCQAVQKNISKKFKVLYYSDKKFARAARLVVFLAFVPVADVVLFIILKKIFVLISAEIYTALLWNQWTPDLKYLQRFPVVGADWISQDCMLIS